ncbi:UDP-N-acetylmuramoyl-tripeptide--D-alanyl-D-alanine ligase [Schaalia vaccimaxillae]|uniref:UDP-N-acetylmuramoyl-tripeptide--D-alanyl-D- alanine ligase n=1 Tax=Schaalia vaccimaxillae TaxID=183916 RepID=UPI0003B30740|nr:UDP-N-acetylmuramoyl-tripeptide--D-alanyl-D-alanine ligase [Schaalia vaccimaxillae]
MQRSIQWIAEAVNGTIVGPDICVNGTVVTDSRLAGKGSLYIARRGEQSDGHDYVQAAHQLGAVAAIVERDVPLPNGQDFTQIIVDDSTRALGALAHAHLEDLRARNGLDVIAVTGSAGKTTTKDLLFQILSEDAATVAPKLSFNNEVGLPLTVLSADESTRHLVLEMGASGIGHIAYLTSIASPDVAIELMVGHAHLGGFGSVEGIARAKAELIEGARPGATVILNADDPNVVAMADRATGPVSFFSTQSSGQADIRAVDIKLDDKDRATFTVETPDGFAQVSLKIVGVHHVHNALAAIAGALALGMDLTTIVGALNDAQALSPHRMAVQDLELNGHRVTLIDDSYNANVDSMRAGLAALASIGQGRSKVAMLSEMLELGEASADTHRQVGIMAAEAGVETLVVLGPDAPYYLEGAGPHVLGISVDSVQDAVEAVIDALVDASVVLVKGSFGSRSWQVAEALQERGISR